MELAIQGRFTTCVADGICFLCLCAGYGGCISLRVAGCRARRKAGCFPGPGWSVLCQVNHMQGKGVFPYPGSPKAQERALQSTRQQRLRMWELNKRCPDPCSSEARGQRNPHEELQSRHLLTCWTKMRPSWNNLSCMTVMGREHTYLQNLLFLFLFRILSVLESSLLQLVFK